jgi:hypothetical protein
VPNHLKLALALCLALWGCVTPTAIDKELALTGDSKELFEKYKQFLTDSQKDRFFAMPDDETRRQFIGSLQIEARVAAYPKPVQDAIWQQRVIPGMDAAAVLLTWGVPHDRDFANQNGVETEWWYFERGSTRQKVQFTQGVVTDVVEEGGGR